mgnify:CR=1 FL=1
MNKVYLFVPLMFYSIPSDFLNKSYKHAFLLNLFDSNLFLLQNALFLCTKKRIDNPLFCEL